jgi:hypothetical protein
VEPEAWSSGSPPVGCVELYETHQLKNEMCNGNGASRGLDPPYGLDTPYGLASFAFLVVFPFFVFIRDYQRLEWRCNLAQMKGLLKKHRQTSRPNTPC